MTREFVYTEPFRRSWKAMGLGDDDAKKLEEMLLERDRRGAENQDPNGKPWKIRGRARDLCGCFQKGKAISSAGISKKCAG